MDANLRHAQQNLLLVFFLISQSGQKYCVNVSTDETHHWFSYSVSDFFILEKMGIDPNSGWMSDGVMQSDSAGKMGDVYGEKFTIYVPVQNHPDFTEGKYLRLFD